VETHSDWDCIGVRESVKTSATVREGQVTSDSRRALLLAAAQWHFWVFNVMITGTAMFGPSTPDTQKILTAGLRL
jgi:hypothetical protein